MVLGYAWFPRAGPTSVKVLFIRKPQYQLGVLSLCCQNSRFCIVFDPALCGCQCSSSACLAKPGEVNWAVPLERYCMGFVFQTLVKSDLFISNPVHERQSLLVHLKNITKLLCCLKLAFSSLRLDLGLGKGLLFCIPFVVRLGQLGVLISKLRNQVNARGDTVHSLCNVIISKLRLEWRSRV